MCLPRRAAALRPLALALLLLVCARAAAWEASLRGLKAVAVDVREVDEQLEKDGITRQQLQQDVEVQLREAGIEVADLEKDENAPFLDVMLVGVKDPKAGFYIFDLMVKFRRSGLVRRSREEYSQTWERRWSGMVMLEELDQIRQRLSSFVDEFTTEHRLQNEGRKPHR